MIDKSIDTPIITAKASYKDVNDQTDYVPFEEPHEVELLTKSGKRGVKAENTCDPEPAPEPTVHRSEKLKKSKTANATSDDTPTTAKKAAVFSVGTKLIPLRPKRFLAVAATAIGLTVLPTHMMAVPTN